MLVAMSLILSPALAQAEPPGVEPIPLDHQAHADDERVRGGPVVGRGISSSCRWILWI